MRYSSSRELMGLPGRHPGRLAGMRIMGTGLGAAVLDRARSLPLAQVPEMVQIELLSYPALPCLDILIEFQTREKRRVRPSQILSLAI